MDLEKTVSEVFRYYDALVSPNCDVDREFRLRCNEYGGKRIWAVKFDSDDEALGETAEEAISALLSSLKNAADERRKALKEALAKLEGA